MGKNNKALIELKLPEDINYFNKHTWAKVKDKHVIIGITDYAQDQLGEILFIELPSVGRNYQVGDIFGQAESAKIVSSLYMPVSGTITDVNSKVEDNPELVNQDPYGEGWMLIIQPENPDDIKQLLSNTDYLKLLEEISE